MLRTTILSVLTFVSLFVRAENPRAGQLVAALAAELDALGRYEVRFAVDAEGRSMEGRYIVEGDACYLCFGDAELYGDAAVRYEVDNSRREVTIAPTGGDSASIVDNPARAFDLLAAGYTAELQGEADGRAVVVLRPERAGSAEVITATVSTDPLRPEKLIYDYDGTQLAVRILTLVHRAKPLPRFDAARYADYEMIDFR